MILYKSRNVADFPRVIGESGEITGLSTGAEHVDVETHFFGGVRDDLVGRVTLVEDRINEFDHRHQAL